MKKLSLFVLLVSMMVSCSSMDMYLKKSLISGKPRSIVIGEFESRNLSYDPFLLKNFRDFLNYDFFKLGYTSVISVDDGSERNKKFFPGSYLHLKGTISQNVYGDPIDSDTSTSIIVKIFNDKDIKVGEVIYISNSDISDTKLLKEISTKLVVKIDGEINK